MIKWGLRFAACLLGLTSVTTLGGGVTFATFRSQTASAGDSFAAGTVVLGDNDSGTAMLALTNAKPTLPGDTDTSCIRITSTGTLDSTVRLYGTVSGSLAPYLTMTVTRGTDTIPSFDSCTNFVGDGVNYVGSGNGVVWTGQLSAFPTSYATGVVDPTAGAPATWTTGTTRSYRIVVQLNDAVAAQGLSATAAFTWEARNK